MEQQITLKRVKRGHDKHTVIHDKQLEFPIPEIKDNNKYYRVVDKFKFDYRGNLLGFNDLYYKDQWYLVCIDLLATITAPFLLFIIISVSGCCNGNHCGI